MNILSLLKFRRRQSKPCVAMTTYREPNDEEPAAVWEKEVTGVFFPHGKIETRTVTVNSVSGHLAQLAKRLK